MASRERSGGILVPPLVLAICAVGGAEAWCGTTGGGSQSFAVKIEIKTPVGNSTQTYTTKCHDCGPAPWHPSTPGDCWSCHGAAGSEFRGYPYRCTDENGTFAKCSDTPCDGKDPPVPPPAPPTPAGSVACMCCSGSHTDTCIPHYIGWAESKEDCASRYPSQCNRCDEKAPRVVGPENGKAQCDASEEGVKFPFFGSCQCTCCTGADCDPAYQGVASSPEDCAKKYPECASCIACDPRYRADCPKDENGDDIVPICDFTCGESPYRGVAVFFIILAICIVCCICVGGVVYMNGGQDELRRRVRKLQEQAIAARSAAGSSIQQALLSEDPEPPSGLQPPAGNPAAWPAPAPNPAVPTLSTPLPAPAPAPAQAPATAAPPAPAPAVTPAPLGQASFDDINASVPVQVSLAGSE